MLANLTNVAIMANMAKFHQNAKLICKLAKHREANTMLANLTNLAIMANMAKFHQNAKLTQIS